MLGEYGGRVRLIFKDFPLPAHPLARPAHVAARCAGAQGKYWEYHDRLFAAQPEFEPARLVRYAEELGLDRERFAACVESREPAAAVDTDVAEARALGIRATPTFIINGEPLLGAHPVETFRRVIDEALRRR